MSDILMQYGLFLAKAITVVVSVGARIGIAFALSRRGGGDDEGNRLEVHNLNRKYQDFSRTLAASVLGKKEFKAEMKSRKAREKARAAQPPRRRLFVLDFKGDIRAKAVRALREEITAVLTTATANDEVLLRLDNAGGLVHEHGLAASQLQRITERNVPLTVSVDKVAASGGYLMACVADRILAAPFAIVGSIGVLAQIPNFHRLMDRSGVDFEQIKAGDFKRTVTMFGENTDEDRDKLREQIEDVHLLFKDFVAENRPALDIAQIATGEHWYGLRARELRLVDELCTSDDYLLAATENADIYEVRYARKKSMAEKCAASMQATLGALHAWTSDRAWAARFDR